MKFSKFIKCLSLGAIMSFSVNSQAATNDIVVYFSASGTTKVAAEALAKKIDAQTLAIEAKQVYTDDDLNYRQDDCRANVEMKDPKVRPEIANDLSAVNDKENVYLGFPIWWGTAPRIIQTFIESYNLEGKNIYLFCTSGGSSIDKSMSDMKSLYPKLNFVKAKRIKLGSADADIESLLSK